MVIEPRLLSDTGTFFPFPPVVFLGSEKAQYQEKKTLANEGGHWPVVIKFDIFLI